MNHRCKEHSPASLSWHEKRREMPGVLRRDGLFTDIELRAGGRSYRAHRVVLAAHCDYFLSLLTSGMKEAEEGVITFHEVDPEVLEAIIDYIYCGELDGDTMSFAMLQEMLMTANMWQVLDLETAILQLLVKLCTHERCLKIFLFVNANAELFRDAAVKQNIENILVETIRDRWNVLVSPPTPAFSPGSLDEDEDDFVARVNDLDLGSLEVILSIKSDQEEIGDFSFSFNQSDICLAVVQWINHDLKERSRHLNRLSSLFCLHQVNGNATGALALLASESERLLGEKTAELTTEMCSGIWCPHRKIQGLMIAHAWSPHLNNRITCDHIFNYFTVPKAMSSVETKPLHADFFYELGQFGELGDGEKHLLVPNSCVFLAPIRSHMLLTVDGGKLSGTVVDAVSAGYQCCYHHSAMYRFCPSNIPECVCEHANSSVAADGNGFVYVVTCARCSGSEQSYDPCCETFKAVPSPERTGKSASNRFSFAHEQKLYHLGGHYLESGNMFSYIFCGFDLQEFSHPDNQGPSSDPHGPPRYKSGHSHVRTESATLADTPKPNGKAKIFDLESASWSDFQVGGSEVKPPFSLGDCASIVVENEVYVLGGYEVKYDHDLKLFYQSPVNSVWILDLTIGKWRQGPAMPQGSRTGYTRGTPFLRDRKIYFSGGACLKINSPSESNQIYQYVPNTKVFALDLENDTWETLLDLGAFASKVNDDTYSVLAIFPTEITLKRLKVRRDPNSGAMFQVKYLNISFPLGGKSDRPVRKIH